MKLDPVRKCLVSSVGILLLFDGSESGFNTDTKPGIFTTIKSGLNTDTKLGTFTKITQIYPLERAKIAKIYRLIPINRDHRSYKDRSVTSCTGRIQPDEHPVAIKELEVEDTGCSQMGVRSTCAMGPPRTGRHLCLSPSKK